MDPLAPPVYAYAVLCLFIFALWDGGKHSAIRSKIVLSFTV